MKCSPTLSYGISNFIKSRFRRFVLLKTVFGHPVLNGKIYFIWGHFKLHISNETWYMDRKDMNHNWRSKMFLCGKNDMRYVFPCRKLSFKAFLIRWQIVPPRFINGVSKQNVVHRVSYHVKVANFIHCALCNGKTIIKSFKVSFWHFVFLW